MLSLGLIVLLFDGFALVYVTKTLGHFGDAHLYKTIKSIKRQNIIFAAVMVLGAAL